MKTNGNDTRPWLAAAAAAAGPYDGSPFGAHFAVMYFEPWDLEPGKAIDPEDFDTVRSTLGTMSEPDIGLAEESAYRTGVSMSRMFGIDAVRIWPGLDEASGKIAEELRYAPDPAAEPCEPDEDTKKLLRGAKAALAGSLEGQES